MTEKLEGSEVPEHKEIDEHASLYFAESPKSTTLLNEYNLEQQRDIVTGALYEAVHNNMTSCPEILEVAYEKGIIKSNEIVPLILEALSGHYQRNDMDSEENSDQKGAQEVLDDMHNIMKFLGLTIKGFVDAGDRYSNSRLNDSDYDHLVINRGMKEIRKEKKGIFKWANF